jgi:DNA-binding GntR family transcriptional regulator
VAVSLDDSRPAYIQIADDLRAAIRSGKIPPGGQLPSTAELTERYQVARMTVRSALRLLRDEGLVVARQGSGVFVRSTYSPQGEESSPDDAEEIKQRLSAISANLDALSKRVSQIEELVRPVQRGRAKSSGA